MHLLLQNNRKPGLNFLLIFSCLALFFLFPFQAFAFAPIVDLGPDTVSCGAPVMLDAGNAGASFTWSTGENTQSITVNTSGIYWVDVTDGGGTSRDSIEVSIFSSLPTPAINDTTICEGELLSLSVQGSGDGTVWYDSPSGGNPIGSGNNLTLSPDSTTSVYAEHFHFTPTRIGLPDTSFGSNRYLLSFSNGQIFNVISVAKINAIHTYSDDQISFDLQIKDPQGTVIFNKAVNINTPFTKIRVPIGIEVGKGDGYRITAENISGPGALSLSTQNNPPFPYTIPGVFEIVSSVSPFPLNRLYYFYDWEIEIPSCQSARGESEISVLPTPKINLGNDTILCRGIGNPLVLDASNPGANYLWQDGSTNPTFTVTETDTFSVIANIGNCLSADEIAVFVYDVPQIPNLLDTTICGLQEITLSNNLTPDPLYTFWRNDSGQFVNFTNDFLKFYTDTTQLLVESINSRPFSLGPANLSVSTVVTNDGADTRGIKIDALQDILIESLAVFPISTSIFSFDLVLLDSNRIEIGRFPQSLAPPYSKEILPVNIFLSKGNGYTLEVQNRVGGNVLRNGIVGDVFPFEVPGFARIPSSTSLSNITTREYNYLYDLKIIPYNSGCRSAPKEITVNVNVPLNMVDSIYSCTELLYDIGNIATNYLWNTGDQTPTININQTGMYILTADDGMNCSVTDSTFVEIPQDAGLPADGILCGDILATNYGPSSTFSWSTGASTPSILVSNPGTYFVSVQEPRGCVLTDTITITGFDTFPVVDLGIDQSVCESLLLDAGNPGFSYLWSTGESSQQITITSSGLYSVFVSNANNCTASDTIGVLITPLPESQFSIPDTVIGGVSRRANFVNQSSFGSYLWEFGDGNTSTAISPSHTYADTGTYCVRLITTDLQNNCGSDTAEKCIVVLQYPVGIEEELLGTPLSIYPNPATDRFVVEVEDLIQEELTLSLRDLKGKLIHQKVWNPALQSTRTSFEISRHPPGIYILQIENSQGSLFKKISIQ